jgi:hypothetical protein
MIDILIPLYIKNRGILRDCITGMAKHTSVDYRLRVCMDGGSSDDVTDTELLLREFDQDHHHCKEVQLLHNKKVLYEAETIARLLDQVPSDNKHIIILPVMNEITQTKWWEVLWTPFGRDSLCMLSSNEPRSLWRNVPHYAMTHKDVIGHEAIVVTSLKFLKTIGWRFEDVNLFICQKFVDDFMQRGGRCWSAPSIEPKKLPYENPPDLKRMELDKRRNSTEVEVVL